MLNENNCVADVAGALRCSHSRGEEILSAVMQALRDGLNDQEAASIQRSLPANVRTMWPREAGPHPGLADLGDEGFLGRVHRLASSASDDETKQMVHAVINALMRAMAIAGDERRATWPALTRLPRDSKIVWMKLFRAACYPVSTISDP
jgi:uncharacterized protein (DUF2267 family)